MPTGIKFYDIKSGLVDMKAGEVFAPDPACDTVIHHVGVVPQEPAHGELVISDADNPAYVFFRADVAAMMRYYDLMHALSRIIANSLDAKQATTLYSAVEETWGRLIKELHLPPFVSFEIGFKGSTKQLSIKHVPAEGLPPEQYTVEFQLYTRRPVR